MSKYALIEDVETLRTNLNCRMKCVSNRIRKLEITNDCAVHTRDIGHILSRVVACEEHTHPEKKERFNKTYCCIAFKAQVDKGFIVGNHLQPRCGDHDCWMDYCPWCGERVR